MTNYSSANASLHLHGPVSTDIKVYGAESATGEPYGTLKVGAGQVAALFFVMKSEDAAAIRDAFATLATDLAIAEVEAATQQDPEAAAELAAADAREQAEGPRRVCCDSHEDEDHQPECGRPLFHTPRADLLAAVHGGDAEAKREWDIREGEQAAAFARAEDHPQRASYATDAQ